MTLLTDQVEIDGAQGEGGGQMLRSALALSVITGRAVRLFNIRARRPKPGLMPQHLQAVQAAAAISGAHVEGAQPRSQAILFQPQGILPGGYAFDIGTAGAASLVLQTLFLPLSFARESSHIDITGGTHVPWSPCYHYLAWHWLRYLSQAGYRAELSLQRAGFYPRGGGLISADIHPAAAPAPLRLTERGALQRITGLSAVANLDIAIALRQQQEAVRRLKRPGVAIDIAVETLAAPSRGTFILLIAEFEHSRCCYYALGAPGKPAEAVAGEAAAQLEAFIATEGAIDPYLADQLLLPLALAHGASELRPSAVTLHLLTNAEIIRHFLPARIEILGELGQPGLVRISGAAPGSLRQPAGSQEIFEAG